MIEAPEILISQFTRVFLVAGKVLKILKSGKVAVISGLNFAVSNTIKVVELVKRDMPELVQVNLFDTVDEKRVKFTVKLAT
jgi:hypothetical protein